MTARLAGLLALCLVALAGLVGCGSGGSDAPPGVAESPATGEGDPGLTGTLTVFAAASLTDAFTGLGDQLMAENPQLEVRFNFAGSSALATQLTQGAPADVFAAADQEQMASVVEEGLAADPQVFASNPLMLAVPVANPAGVAPPDAAGIPGLAELLTDELVLAVCAPQVPCGAAATEVLDATGSTTAPATYEEDVRAVLTKVELGEVDAGLVYVSDVHAAGDRVLAFAFRESARAVNRYPLTVVEGAPNPEAAQAFVDLVLSDEGRAALADAGFQQP